MNFAKEKYGNGNGNASGFEFGVGGLETADG